MISFIHSFFCFLRLFVASSGARYFLRLIFLTAFFPEDLLVFTFTVFLTGFFATFLTFAFTTFPVTVFRAACFAGLAVVFAAVFAAFVIKTVFIAFVALTSAPSIWRQPCASRTAIMADKMSFQICCFMITSFGNMQPSQQM